MIDDPAEELRLLCQHADVLFEMDADGRMTGLNEPGDDLPPRLFLARGARSHGIWMGRDVPDATVAACRATAADLPPWDGEASYPTLYEPLRATLARDAPIVTESIGPAFRFGEPVVATSDATATLIDDASAHLLERYFPYTRSILAARAPVCGVIVDGWVVCACFSARQRQGAAEAGVATEEPYRGHGLAPLAVSAWRHAVERAGQQPLYSTEWDNAASRAVARKLRLVAYTETVSLR